VSSPLLVDLAIARLSYESFTVERFESGIGWQKQLVIGRPKEADHRFT
jgi:hypothetical protein